MAHDSIQHELTRGEERAASLPGEVLFAAAAAAAAAALSSHFNDRDGPAFEEIFLSGLPLHLVVDVAAEIRFL